MKNKTIVRFNYIAYVFMLLMNTLVVTFNLNNTTVKAISDRYQSLVTPAGFTFSIWLLIYTLLLFLIIYLQKEQHTITKMIGKWLIVTSILNGTWILTWQYEQLFISLVITIFLFTVLAIINKRLHTLPIHQVPAIVFLPISIYFAWSFIAMLENLAVWLVSLQIEIPISATLLASLLVIIIGIVTILITKHFNKSSFSFTIVFALFGIFMNPHTHNTWFQALLLLTMASISIYALYLKFYPKKK